jgi:hypothetical protein
MKISWIIMMDNNDSYFSLTDQFCKVLLGLEIFSSIVCKSVNRYVRIPLFSPPHVTGWCCSGESQAKNVEEQLRNFYRHVRCATSALFRKSANFRKGCCNSNIFFERFGHLTRKLYYRFSKQRPMKRLLSCVILYL